ncbi:MAG: hypothetical protein KJN77_06145 [Gammaproteobacteria bacterium]|nr:hypothetical protein [Gammaproteobacteria bacterium]
MNRRILILLALLVAQSIPAVAESKEKNLEQWLDRDLLPYVQQQLVKHPRFKNETVMFVVLHDNAPASATNALALSIRDRMLAAAVATQGVAIGWQQGRSGASLESQPQDCSHDDVHYYIGVEIKQKLDSSYSVSVRALDLEDRNWVTGFGKRWQGNLSTTQRQAMRQSRIDETFLGARDVPFTLAQTDLLAALLAHKLTCTLKKTVVEEYVVASANSEPDAPGLRGTVELISNNLANRQALTISRDATKSNAILSGKAYQIDGALFQYWLTVTPKDESGDITALSASAYVVLPEEQRFAEAASNEKQLPTRPAEALPATISIPNAGKDALLGPLRITAPRAPSDCDGIEAGFRTAGYMAGLGRCSLLQAESRSDAIVFFLEHQANLGLVRLAAQDCRERTTARIARGGETLSFPIAMTTTARGNWSETYEWQLEPELDTYYAIVVTDAEVARRVANHIDDLPIRCSAAVRPGLADDRLEDWLSDFAMLTARSSRHIDWRAIRVKDIL